MIGATFFIGNFKTEYGGMAERLNAVVLKTIVPKGTGGSNPSSSAFIFPKRKSFVCKSNTENRY